jgi:nucleotide-binding universal stress UspA family protein
METTQSHPGTPGTVVVGVDGTTSSDRALLWAAEQAFCENRTLTVIHVDAPISSRELGALATSAMATREVLEAHRTHGSRLLETAEQLVSHSYPDLAIERVLEEGDVCQVLLRHAAASTMVVLGSRGRGAVRSLLFGSVGVALARGATCPVVIVRPHHPGVVRRGVIVGTDGLELCRDTLEFAYRQASLHRLPLTVLHCIGMEEGRALPHGIVPDHQPGLDGPRSVLAEAVAGLSDKFPDVGVTLRLGNGLASDLLAESSNVMDLTVVGRHAMTIVDHLSLGSSATPVVEHGGGAVAVVPSVAPAAL